MNERRKQRLVKKLEKAGRLLEEVHFVLCPVGPSDSIDPDIDKIAELNQEAAWKIGDALKLIESLMLAQEPPRKDV